MEIISKFNVGDAVYFIHDNKVHKAFIYSFWSTYVFDPTDGLTKGNYGYGLHCDDVPKEKLKALYLDDELFSTKEELIKTL